MSDRPKRRELEATIAVLRKEVVVLTAERNDLARMLDEADPPEPTWQERAVVTVGGWLDAGVAALPEWVRW